MMLTWKQVKEELESQGINDEVFINWIDIHTHDKLIVKVDEHNIAEVSSY